MKVIAAFVGCVLAFYVVVACIGWGVWRRETERSLRTLDRPRQSSPGVRLPYSASELDGVPAPVARYFRFALTDGQPSVHRARLTQVGELALRPGEWKSFTAIEVFVTTPPAFQWDATVRMMPLLPVRVRDGYVARAGAMEARLLGLFPVASAQDTPEMAAGELMRFLAESVWLPTALLPSAGVSWTPVSDTIARATLTDGANAVSLDFHFGTRGEIDRVEGLRYRDVNGTLVRTRWVGHFGDYQRLQGVMIPLSGFVEWILPSGPEPYWRGRIVSAELSFAPPQEAQ